MTCADCGTEIRIGDWPFCGKSGHANVFSRESTSVHPSERVVVWMNPATGKVAYPGMNNIPMPGRYQKAGYERHELASLKAVENFEKAHAVRNESIWFNRNGRSFDDGY